MSRFSSPFRLIHARVGFLAVMVTTACTDATGPDDAAGLLQQNRELWARSAVTSYRYVIVRSCECAPESAGPVTVEVRDGQIVARRYESGAPVELQFSAVFTTVPGLFDLIEEAVTLPAASLAVRYHPDLGYPESIAIDWVAGAVDDEVSYRISDFTELR
jgi:hypothetical protein